MSLYCRTFLRTSRTSSMRRMFCDNSGVRLFIMQQHKGHLHRWIEDLYIQNCMIQPAAKAYGSTKKSQHYQLQYVLHTHTHTHTRVNIINFWSVLFRNSYTAPSRREKTHIMILLPPYTSWPHSNPIVQVSKMETLC